MYLSHSQNIHLASPKFAFCFHPPPPHHHHPPLPKHTFTTPQNAPYLARRHPLCTPFSKENISMSFPTVWNWWFTYSSTRFTGPVTWRASVFLSCESYRSLAVSCFVKGSWKLDFRDSQSQSWRKKKQKEIKKYPFFFVCVWSSSTDLVSSNNVSFWGVFFVHGIVTVWNRWELP